MIKDITRLTASIAERATQKFDCAGCALTRITGSPTLAGTCFSTRSSKGCSFKFQDLCSNLRSRFGIRVWGRLLREQRPKLLANKQDPALNRNPKSCPVLAKVELHLRGGQLLLAFTFAFTVRTVFPGTCYSALPHVSPGFAGCEIMSEQA